MRIKRPAILFLGALILGIIIAYSLVPALFKLILCAIAIFLYGKLFIEKKLYIKTIFVLAMIFIIGVLRFNYVERIYDGYARKVETLGKGTHIITGKVDNIGKSTNSNYYILSNCISEGMSLGKCRCYFDDKLISNAKIGNYIKVTAGLSNNEEPSNEGEFNQKNYYRSSGIAFISFAREIEIVNSEYDRLKQRIYEVKIQIKNQIKKIFNEKNAGLFSAMVTGDKSTIDKTQRKKFSDNGIAHILAISGLHLSILGLAIFELLRKRFSVNFSAATVNIFIVLYGIFIDAGPSSLRAITMLFIRFLSLAIGRTYDSQNTLYIIAFIFLILQPYLLFNAGFQFSYMAIFALNQEVKITKIKKADKRISKILNNNYFDLKKIKISAVVVLTFFLFPITIYHYFTYPLYSILLNLIVIPLMSLVLGFGLIGLLLSFIYLPIGKILTFVVHIIFLIYDKLCEMVETMPYHLLVLGKPTLYELLYYIIALFLIIYSLNETTKVIIEKYEKYKLNKSDRELKREIFKNKIKEYIRVEISIILLIISVVVISIRPHSDMRMTFISIGQGDSILIESNDLILTIDGGSTTNTGNGQYILTPHIKSRAIDHIDYSYITHADADHTNGIMYLLENEDEVKIKNIVLPITAINDTKFDKIKMAATENATNIIYMKEGDIVNLKENLKLTVLNPNKNSLNSKKLDQNEMSLTFRIDYKNHSALFTGDIGKETMGRMLKDDFAIKNMDVEVLKVPHHGSKNSNIPEFFEKASPEYSVISYGKKNNYGHPNGETVESLTNIGSTILKTGESGQIDIYFDEEKVKEKKFK